MLSVFGVEVVNQTVTRGVMKLVVKPKANKQ
jgi:hypothetical protein